MSRVLLALSLCAASLLAGGCTLLWLFNNDPAGLPCEFSDEDPVGRCLKGYTCVGGVCIHAGEKEVGERCARTEECKDGLACNTAFEGCEDGGDDVNCSLIANDDIDLRCHTICDSVDDKSCASGERCYILSGVEGVPGVCQSGVCASDTDCSTIDGSPALCAGVFEDGKVGLCLERCDALSCALDGSCAGCDGLDGDPDEGLTCVPIPGRVLDGANNVCDAFGTTPDFAPCGGVGNDLCRFGSFCVAVEQSAFCTPWCSVGGGNPACPEGHACQSVNGTVGFCL